MANIDFTKSDRITAALLNLDAERFYQMLDENRTGLSPLERGALHIARSALHAKDQTAVYDLFDEWATVSALDTVTGRELSLYELADACLEAALITVH